MRHGNIGYLVQRQHTPFTCCSSTNTMIPASPVAVLPLKHTTPSARKLPRPRIPLLPYSSRLSIRYSFINRSLYMYTYTYPTNLPLLLYRAYQPQAAAGLCWLAAFVSFQSGVTRNSKETTIPSCHLPVPRDAPPREIAQLGGELCLPLSNKTCHLLVFTYNCVRRDLSRRLC